VEFLPDSGTLSSRIRRDHEQTTAPEPHTGLKAKVALAAVKATGRSRNWPSILTSTPIRSRPGRPSWRRRFRGFRIGKHGPAAPAIDVKSLHAKIGELTLENDFLEERSPGGIAERKAMIDREHDLSITRQAEVLRISRAASITAAPVSAADLEIMRRLDRLHLEYPSPVSRMLRGLLALQGCRSAAGM